MKQALVENVTVGHITRCTDVLHNLAYIILDASIWNRTATQFVGVKGGHHVALSCSGRYNIRVMFLRMRDKCKLINVQRNAKHLWYKFHRLVR